MDQKEIISNVDFEQARLEHCIRVYNEEKIRREGFDKTAQYYLTFVTAFLAVLFLKIETLQSFSDLLATKGGQSLIWITYISLGAMLLSLLMALISILECIRVRRFSREFPSNPAIRFFSKNSPYSGQENEAAFIKITAMSYISSVESNFYITERKGLWIERAAYFILVSLFSFFVLYTILTYLTIS